MSFPTVSDARKRMKPSRSSKKVGRSQQELTHTKTGEKYVSSQHAARMLGIEEREIAALIESGVLVRKSSSPWYTDRIHQREV
ncbi:hypothetical protein [Burkholderia phage BCSR129]|nr:hypothetical protein [Burkholderia phage BCSR129]